jgi:predicted RNA-binding protein associated with RNAse of E/G family
MDIQDPYDISRDIDVVWTRLPDDVIQWRHRKLLENNEVSISAFHETSLGRPITARGEVIVDNEFFGILYFFWDEWFNVIRIYDKDLEFKGYYSDIITPVQKTLTVYTATDLFLDFFMFPDGTYVVEDEDEFDDAVEKGLIDEGISRKARVAIEKLTNMAETGEYPPEFVRRFPEEPVSVLKQIRTP